MTSPASITIVTPSFNQAAYLEQTIRSVLDQGYPNLQFGVVDGGSTDGSVEIIERYRSQLDFAIIEPDHGQTEAINKGIRRAQGQIIGWLCSDDTLLPGALQTIGQHFADHPDHDWIAGACQVIDPSGQIVSVVRPRGQFTLAGVLLRGDDQPFDLPQPGIFWVTPALDSRIHLRLGPRSKRPFPWTQTLPPLTCSWPNLKSEKRSLRELLN